ncbi:MAG TPA: hypothetical protein DCZ61_01230 [Lachnospiraceae bacterium]|nr:hypothetical protein [Lachnospiraceae bacterium]
MQSAHLFSLFSDSFLIITPKTPYGPPGFSGLQAILQEQSISIFLRPCAIGRRGCSAANVSDTCPEPFSITGELSYGR